MKLLKFRHFESLGAILVDSTDYLAVYSEIVESVQYFIVSLRVL